jgi:hypothetical protein
MEDIMKNMIMIAVMLVAGSVIAGILPANEEKILLDVARQCKLTADQTRLLLTIRKIENGRSGLELGVGDGIKGHPARRYAGDFEKSLRLQAEWASGTIQKRYNGDLESFAKRYCPPNWKIWVKNANFYLAKQREVTPVTEVKLAKTDKVVSPKVRKAGDADTINERLTSGEMFKRG